MAQRKTKKRRRDFTINPDGSKSVPLVPETKDVLEKQSAAFRKKFGREPSGDDPIFFDPDADEPRPLSEAQIDQYQSGIIQAMQTANIPGELIYAFQKTGRLVTEDTMPLLTDEELEEWNKAIAEYRTAPRRS
jgi:hypothetical protein